jgi:hypothetical protein
MTSSAAARRTLRFLTVAVAAIGLWLVASSVPVSAQSAPDSASTSWNHRAPVSDASTAAAKSPSSAKWRSHRPASAQVAPGVAAPAPMFTQCPAVGLNTGCRLLIVINPDGSVVVLTDPNQSPTYDGSEDTLVGVQNNSNSFVQSLNLSSTTPAFGFDGDGPCTQVPTDPNCPPTGFGTTGYEGPNTTFTNVSVDGLSGTVNFTNPPGTSAGCGSATPQPGLAPGASAYFGLEEAIDTSNLALSGVPVVQPCPTTTTAAPQVAAAEEGPALARTGQNTDTMVRLAFMLLLSGAVLIALSRRLALRAAVRAV